MGQRTKGQVFVGKGDPLSVSYSMDERNWWKLLWFYGFPLSLTFLVLSSFKTTIFGEKNIDTKGSHIHEFQADEWRKIEERSEWILMQAQKMSIHKSGEE